MTRLPYRRLQALAAHPTAGVEVLAPVNDNEAVRAAGLRMIAGLRRPGRWLLEFVMLGAFLGEILFCVVMSCR
ncbi:MAG TPA: hypothetical protein VG248_17400 [Caulobacteraceae bacterium]|jgi:hypothetical protein|nr:hypothetical protein [Caulobacteraceae bacterium]